MLRLFSISLGCPKNRVDTEHALGSLGPVTTVSHINRADIVFINTCGFIAPAIKESVRTILECVHDVEKLPTSKKPLLVVAGCLVGRYGIETLAADLPEVELWLHNNTLTDWGQQVLTALRNREHPHKQALTQHPSGRLLSTGPSYAWLKISDGCNHACSFCTIPQIRGKALRSTPKEILLKEAETLLAEGIKELVVVAQDTTSWGRDGIDERGLQSLLEGLLPLNGLEWLRLMYLYPAGLTPELLRFLRDAGKPFIPYFDIPLQHAASPVLSRMGRPFAHNPRKVVERVRNVFPEAALRTSIIVGFPGETSDDFEELCDFVEETKFCHLGVFSYQPEEGTPAASMPDQIPDALKEERRSILMQLQAEISADFLDTLVGTAEGILVDTPQGEWPGLHEGRTWFQAPEIDGITYISGPGVEPGALVQADITERSTYDLVALTAPETE